MLKKFKKTFIGDKEFYRYVLLLVIPMIIQNAITSFVSFLDNIMVGQIGTEQMSGVAIVNQLMFVFQIEIIRLCGSRFKMVAVGIANFTKHFVFKKFSANQC